MPVYNEEGIIAHVIDKWTKKLLELNIDFQILAYNDGSKDNTLEILTEIEKQNKYLKTINKPNSGHGPTILRGYSESIDAEWIFQIDSDDEIDVIYFEKLWANRNQFDFLIGNRINRQTPNIRKFISWFSRLTVFLLYSRNIMDVNCPYRLMRTEKFKEIFNLIPNDTLAPNIIITGVACKKKFNIYQTDVSFKIRQTGEVSIKKWKLLKFSIKSFWQTIKFRFQNKL